MHDEIVTSVVLDTIQKVVSNISKLFLYIGSKEVVNGRSSFGIVIAQHI